MIDSTLYQSTPVLDHGYIRLIESWGSDERIIEAARMSTNKGFQGWGPSVTYECKNEQCSGYSYQGPDCPVKECSNCGSLLVKTDERKGELRNERTAWCSTHMGWNETGVGMRIVSDIGIWLWSFPFIRSRCPNQINSESCQLAVVSKLPFLFLTRRSLIF